MPIDTHACPHTGDKKMTLANQAWGPFPVSEWLLRSMVTLYATASDVHGANDSMHFA